jgi:hypothetical protein
VAHVRVHGAVDVVLRDESVKATGNQGHFLAGRLEISFNNLGH